MNPDIYIKLRKHLDQHPIPLPATGSGIELKLSKSLFTEEEAWIALQLSALLERPEKIYKRFKHAEISLEVLEEKLFGLFQKGSIRGVKDRKHEGKFLYSKMPLAIGVFEAQVDKISKETAELFFEYEKEGFADALLGNKTNQMRTIPLNVKIDPEFHVSNYDDITKIIKNSPGPFAVMNCVCRQAKDTMDKSCLKTEKRETCILIEDGVDFAKNLGVGREISRDETLKLITQAKKTGLVLQPENNQHPHFVCCCCGCCCGVLTAAKSYDQPVKYLHSNYFAEIDTEACNVCETCLERCPMDAIDRTNNHMATNLDRCIGCGACIPTCKERAIRLIKKEKEVVPPMTDKDMYKSILIERYGLAGSLKFVTKAALGMKI
jgi:electron transport complex protein RnfB